MALSASKSPFPEFEEGVAHLAARRWDAAIVSLRLAAQREPGRLAVIRALATACLQIGNIPEARAAIAALTANQPMSAEAWRLAAQLEWKLNRVDHAMELLRRGLDHLPNSQVLHRQTALFWGARGKLEASARHANRAHDDGGQVHKYLGVALGALDPRHAGLGASGDDPDSSHRTTLFDPAPPAADDAGSDWFDRVAQDPKLLDSLLDLPNVDADLQMLRDLESRLANLLQSQPHHPDRQLVLARLQVKVDALPAAMLSVRRALRANPNYVEAHRLRAVILGKIGAHDEAVDVLEALVKRGLDWADIHYQIAELQSARGHPAEARGHLYSAIRLNPRFDRAKQLLERCAA